MENSRIHAHNYGVKTLYCYFDNEGSTKAMSEGDIYFVTDGKYILESVWDDVSEELFSDDVRAYKNIEDALNASNDSFTYYMDGRVEKNF